DLDQGRGGGASGRLAGLLAAQPCRLRSCPRQAHDGDRGGRRDLLALMPATAESWRAGAPARAGGLLLLAAGLAVVLFFSITVGARPISLADVWAALTATDPDSTTHRIILELRLPRTLVGLLVGAALGLAGAILQGATRNPLADP